MNRRNPDASYGARQYVHSPYSLRTAGKEYATVKLYLSADIEGTAGIDTWDETEIGREKYAYFAQQMTRRSAPPSRARSCPAMRQRSRTRTTAPGTLTRRDCRVPPG